jgi:hypothetical protein
MEPRNNPELFDERTARRSPDIWYHTKIKRGNVKEINLNLIEVTIPWNNVAINSDKFQKDQSDKYIMPSFRSANVLENTLYQARERKI